MARIRRLDPLELQLAETHARRGDERSRARTVRDDPPVTWLPAGIEGDPLALPQLYAGHVDGAFIPKGKARALHLLVKFPESVRVESTADAEAALKLAVDFAESIFGGDAVFAARMDRDEKSLTNADLFIAPRYMKRTKHSEKLAVSLTRHMKMMTERRLGHLPQDKDILRAQGEALQDEFAEFLRGRGYQALRGQKKETNGPDWISPEAYGVSTDRKIAEAHREVADEEFRQAADERATAARDRADIEGRLASKAQELDDREAALAKAKAEALARRKQAEADAERVIAQAVREAQTIRDAAHAEAETEKAAAAKIVREARETAERSKAAAIAAAEREQQLAATENALITMREEVAEAEHKARDARLEVARRLAEAKRAEGEAAEVMAAATLAATDADIASRQLALVSRGMTDASLELVVDDDPRGVRMNENAMDHQERDAYRACWSDLIRSIARAAALALAKAREVVASAAREAREKLEEAAAKIRDDRSRLLADTIDLNRRELRFEAKLRSFRRQTAAAEAFSKAWEAVPAEQRTPAVNAIIERADRLAALAATLPLAQVVKPKSAPDHTDSSSPAPHGRDNGERSM